MATLETLRANGWHLSSEGLTKLLENESFKDIKTVTRKALDIDLKDICVPVIATEITKDVFGPVVLQIIKLRNISASKAKPNSQTAPRMLKLSLTDGYTNCQAIEIKQIPALHLENTPPGTKLLIDGAQIISGCLLLDLKCCKVLGGYVAALVERWEISKLMPSHVRVTEDGPPAWVNFGKKIITNLNNTNFKSLKNKNKENTKEDAEFLNQRQDAISEAAQGAIKKVFGGGVKIPQTYNEQPTNVNNVTRNTQNNMHVNNEYRNNTSANPRPPKQPRGKGREKIDGEKIEKPSQRVSLFDFLEDKLPVAEPTKPEYIEQPRDNYNKSRNKYNNGRDYERKDYERKDYERKDYERKDYERKDYERKDYENPRNNQGKYQNKYNERRDEKPQENRYQKSNMENKYQNDRYQNDKYQNDKYQNDKYQNDKYQNDKYQNDKYQTDKFQMERKDHEFRNNERFQQEKPPRFQRQQRNENPVKFVQNNYEPKVENSNIKQYNNHVDTRNKPDTNNFINKLASEINNMSLYNSKYENEKLHQKPSENNTNWKWKTGDRCMAKYWEDNKFYNAVVTGVTNKTCMVEFLEYGNFEEVLHCDCIPISSEKEQPQMLGKHVSDNQQYSGNIEFRRGKSRPFVNRNQKPVQGNRNYDS